MTDAPDLILHRGLFTTLDRVNPTASAVAIEDGAFTAVEHDNEVVPLREGTVQPCLVSLGAGLLADVIDSLLRVRSPAPPAIALVGLLAGGPAIALARGL